MSHLSAGITRTRVACAAKRVPVAVVERLLGLYRNQYFDLKVQHFHENLPPTLPVPPVPKIFSLRLQDGARKTPCESKYP